MIVLLGSKNPSKSRSVLFALEELNIKNFEIIPIAANSGVSSKPIGFEIIRGAENRNAECKKAALDNNIDYDYICSLEGGFTIDENGLPFIVTYAIVEDKLGNKSTGKSLGLRLSRKMYDYLREGYSLNKLIEELIKVENNKHNLGITGYLSNGLLKRDKIDTEAVLTAFIPLLFSEERKILDQAIELKLDKKTC